MAQKRISQLDVLSDEPKDASIIPLVQDGVTMSVTFKALKQKMSKDVETSVDTKVDNKLKNKTNYVATTMNILGYAHNSFVSVREFWNKLHSKYGNNGVIQFNWSNAEAAYLGDYHTNYMFIGGGTLIYTCNGAPDAWKNFSAIYFSGYTNEIYHIRCTIDANVSSDTWSITKLADTDAVNAINSTLLNLNQKFDDTYKYYPNTTKIIGKWYDGANIIRAVIPKSDVSTVYNTNDRQVDVAGSWLATSNIKIPLKAYQVLSNSISELSFILNGDKYRLSSTSNIVVSNIEYVIVEYVAK